MQSPLCLNPVVIPSARGTNVSAELNPVKAFNGLRRVGSQSGSGANPGSRFACSAGKDGDMSLALNIFQSSAGPDAPPSVSVDNDTSDAYTIISVSSPNRPGLLQLITLTFRDLGLDVGKAVVDMDEGGRVADQFFVTSMDGKKVTNSKDLKHITTCVLNVLKQDLRKKTRGGQNRPHSFSYDRTPSIGGSMEERRRTELLYSLMDTYIKNDVLSIQKSIVDHVEYTVARSRYKFDDFEAYQVRQALTYRL